MPETPFRLHWSVSFYWYISANSPTNLSAPFFGNWVVLKRYYMYHQHSRLLTRFVLQNYSRGPRAPIASYNFTSMIISIYSKNYQISFDTVLTVLGYSFGLVACICTFLIFYNFFILSIVCEQGHWKTMTNFLGFWKFVWNYMFAGWLSSIQNPMFWH